jgi:hypothetical protein
VAVLPSQLKNFSNFFALTFDVHSLTFGNTFTYLLKLLIVKHFMCLVTKEQKLSGRNEGHHLSESPHVCQAQTSLATPSQNQRPYLMFWAVQLWTDIIALLAPGTYAPK